MNLFENPNVSAQLAERIQTEDMVDFRLNYAFDRTEGYYSTSKQPKDVIHLYTKVSKVYDSKGNFTGYAMINIDNTERIDAMSRICDFREFLPAYIGLCEGRLCQAEPARPERLCHQAMV